MCEGVVNDGIVPEGALENGECEGRCVQGCFE